MQLMLPFWKRTTFVSGIQVLQHSELLHFRNPSTPAFRTPLFQESKYSGIQNSVVSGIQEPCAISADSIHYIVCTMDLYYSRRQCAVRPQLLQCTVSARPLAIMPHQRSHYAPPKELLCPTKGALFVHQTKKHRNFSALGGGQRGALLWGSPEQRNKGWCTAA